MPTKQVKPTIGLIKCPMASHYGEVRKQVNGILYFQCLCGKITPSREMGQRWIFDNAKIFSDVRLEEFNSYPRVGGLSVYLDKVTEEPVYDPKKEGSTRARSPLEPEPVTEKEKQTDSKPEPKKENWAPGFI